MYIPSLVLQFGGGIDLSIWDVLIFLGFMALLAIALHIGFIVAGVLTLVTAVLDHKKHIKKRVRDSVYIFSLILAVSNFVLVYYPGYGEVKSVWDARNAVKPKTVDDLSWQPLVPVDYHDAYLSPDERLEYKTEIGQKIVFVVQEQSNADSTKPFDCDNQDCVAVSSQPNRRIYSYTSEFNGKKTYYAAQDNVSFKISAYGSSNGQRVNVTDQEVSKLLSSLVPYRAP